MLLICNRAPVTMVKYAVSVNGKGVPAGNNPSLQSLTAGLNSSSLTHCDCLAHKVHRLYLLATEFDVIAKESDLADVTKTAWTKSNSGK